MQKSKAVAERLTQTARSNQKRQYIQHEHKGMVGPRLKKNIDTASRSTCLAVRDWRFEASTASPRLPWPHAE
jgi:hypothetical protein